MAGLLGPGVGPRRDLSAFVPAFEAFIRRKDGALRWASATPILLTVVNDCAAGRAVGCRAVGCIDYARPDGGWLLIKLPGVIALCDELEAAPFDAGSKLLGFAAPQCGQ